jgi:hypothetical protein
MSCFLIAVVNPAIGRIPRFLGAPRNAFTDRVRPWGMNDLPRWPRIAVAAAAVVGLGVGVAGTAVVVGLTDGDDRTQGIDPAGITLVAYDTCDSALHELKAAALPHVGPFGLGGDAVAYGEDVAIADGKAAAAPREAAPGAAGKEQSAAGTGEPAPPAGHSGTNTHESDVDEPDIVKTDGRRVVSIADGRLRVVDAATHKQTANLTLPTGYATQLLLAGDRALVLTGGGGMVEPMPREGDIAPGEPAPGGGSAPGEPAPDGSGIAPGEPAPDGGDSPGEPVPDAPKDSSPPIGKPTDPSIAPSYGTQLALVDLTGQGTVLGTLAVEGGYLDARQVGSVARVVVRSTPRLTFSYPDGVTSPAGVEAKNRAVVESSSISDWLPRFQLDAAGHRSSGQLVDCTAVSHPKSYTGEGLLTVLTFDLARDLGTGDPIGIAADGDTVYGTGTKLYVADDHVTHAGEMPTEKPAPSGGQATEIYQFDISSPGRPVHVASGGVPGSLLNQYSLSEHEGNLRVATTAGMTEQSHSMVSVLTRRGNELAQVGQVDGLGKGERIYAVRFVGATAYVVTFRQTDPLYTVDLSDPATPRVTGELKITGYSAYLHPLGPDRLLGVGQEATAEGMTTGTQVSLFDTSGQSARRLGQLQYAGGHSEVEGDPHAFLYWPDKDLVVIPMSGTLSGSSGAYPDSGALILKVAGNTVSEKGMVRHAVASDGMPFMPRRALVVGDELWTVSQTGMLVSNLDTLAQVAWLPFT